MVVGLFLQLYSLKLECILVTLDKKKILENLWYIQNLLNLWCPWKVTSWRLALNSGVFIGNLKKSLDSAGCDLIYQLINQLMSSEFAEILGCCDILDYKTLLKAVGPWKQYLVFSICPFSRLFFVSHYP